MKKTLFLLFAGLVLFTACDDDEKVNVVVNVSGYITTPTTWDASHIYLVEGGVSVNSDLVILPGTVIKFEEDAYFIIGASEHGSLTAIGNASQPITFTSSATNPSAGDWRGIEFWNNNSNQSAMAFCLIEYAGNTNGYDGAIYLSDTEISLVNCTIRNSETNGIYASNSTFKEFDLNTISDCGLYPVEAPAKSISAIKSTNIISGKGILIDDGSFYGIDETWHTLTVPYIFYDGLSIDEGAVLTLEPGCVLKFMAEKGLYVGGTGYGQLVANGTALLPVIFTSAAVTPSAGDWRGIEFWGNTTNGTVLDNCKVLYGGSSNGYQANIYIQDAGSNISIRNTEIGFSENCGIAAYNATPELTNVIFHNNSTDECY